MNEFNIMTEANYQHRQSIQAARDRQRSRQIKRHATAFRSHVRTVAVDAAMVGVILMAVVTLVACAVS